MKQSNDGRDTAIGARAWKLCAVALALGLQGCGDSEPEVVKPVGRLVQEALHGPVGYTTLQNWHIAIEDGDVVVVPPEGATAHTLRYSSQGMRDHIGTLDLRAWEGGRRSVLLPGRVKITMHGQGGALLRVSIYEGDESHEIDVLTQTVMHSRISDSVARRRDAREHDGETGHLITTSFESVLAPIDNLVLMHLYTQDSDLNGMPMQEVIAPRPLARQVEEDIRLPDPVSAIPVDTESACEGAPVERGGLARQLDGSLLYSSRSGLWTVKVDEHTITATRSVGGSLSAKWEVWGDPHENLNGKHIKDWEATRRTLLLDDGTKITMDAEGEQGIVLTTSIYDGAQSHEIGNVDNVLRHSCVHTATAAMRDAAEADGETAYLVIMRSPASAVGSLFTENVYSEALDSSGEPVRTFDAQMLGETGEMDINPNLVRDYYDDSRLGHT